MSLLEKKWHNKNKIQHIKFCGIVAFAADFHDQLEHKVFR